MQKYNLFFNEAKLSVINYDKNQLNILRSNERFIYEEQNDLNTCINDFLHHRNDIEFYVLTENESQLLNTLTSFFIFKRAAGGVVYNEAGKILVMSRFDHYDFPKGHIEEGESPQQTAIREVKEETNIIDLSLQDKIADTYHIFFAKDTYYLKETQWFKMTTRQTDNLIPQTEEHIEALWWFSLRDIKNNFSKFYPSLQEMIQQKVLE
jgi:8-oxo-dGTP pyrophosphatase MutT (NUDIX family)